MEENKKLSTGLTVWLWIIFVINVIVGLLAILTTIGASAVAATLGLGGGYIGLCVVSLVLEVVVIVGLAMMLFGHKKAGFFVLVAAAVIGLVVNIITYNMLGTLTAGNIVKSLISAVVVPLVTFLLAKKDIDNGVLA
ncbi:MAG: hypothetical protein ACI4ES_10610 [Roseburia sp.]